MSSAQRYFLTMLEVLYPTREGPWGVIETEAVLLNGSQVHLRADRRSHPLFASHANDCYLPSESLREAGAGERMQVIVVEPDGDHDHISIAAQGASGIWLVGGGESLTLRPQPDGGVNLHNGLGVVFNWREQPGAWFDLNGKEIGKRLLLALPALIQLLYGESNRVHPYLLSRPSGLAERAA